MKKPFNSESGWTASIGLHGSREGYFCMRFPRSSHNKFNRTFVCALTNEGFAKAVGLLKEYDSLCKTPMHAAELPQDFVAGILRKRGK